MAKATILDSPARLYAGVDDDAQATELPVGAEIELGEKVTSRGKVFVATRLPDGSAGYVPGDAKVYLWKRQRLVDATAPLRDGPSEDAKVMSYMQRDEEFDITGSLKTADRIWVQVRTNEGKSGFIENDVKVIAAASAETPGDSDSIRSGAQNDMLLGGLFCVGGVLVTAVTYSSASQDGGSYWIAYGPVLFGGWRFLKGLFRYTTAD